MGDFSVLLDLVIRLLTFFSLITQILQLFQ